MDVKFSVNMSTFTVLVHLLICFTYSAADDNKPEQIHIAYTGISSERIVNYVTPSPELQPGTVVAYGTSPDKLIRKKTGTSFKFGTHGHYFSIHNVKVRRTMLNIIRSASLRDLGSTPQFW